MKFDMFDEGHPVPAGERAIRRAEAKRKRKQERYASFMKWQEDRRDALDRIERGADFYQRAMAALDFLENVEKSNEL